HVVADADLHFGRSDEVGLGGRNGGVFKHLERLTQVLSAEVDADGVGTGRGERSGALRAFDAPMSDGTSVVAAEAGLFPDVRVVGWGGAKGDHVGGVVAQIPVGAIEADVGGNLEGAHDGAGAVVNLKLERRFGGGGEGELELRGAAAGLAETSAGREQFGCGG